MMQKSTWCMEVEKPIAVVMMPQRKHPKATMCVLSYLSPRIPLTGELRACRSGINEYQRTEPYEGISLTHGQV